MIEQPKLPVRRVPRWAVAGKEVTLTRWLFRGVTVGGKPNGVWISAPIGAWTFPVGDREVELRLEYKPNTRVPFITLWCRGRKVPHGDVIPAQHLAPPGALCAVHPEAAALLACGTCGNFACAGCSAPDGCRCERCFGLAKAGAPEVVSEGGGEQLLSLLALGAGFFAAARLFEPGWAWLIGPIAGLVVHFAARATALRALRAGASRRRAGVLQAFYGGTWLAIALGGELLNQLAEAINR